jgi:hypothetical protein
MWALQAPAPFRSRQEDFGPRQQAPCIAKAGGARLASMRRRSNSCPAAIAKRLGIARSSVYRALA